MTRPDNPKVVLGVELAREGVQKRHPGAERTPPPPPNRSISPFPELRQPARVEIEEAAQSMRPRATHAVAKLLALPAVVAGLIAVLYAGSGWLNARSKREAAEAQLAEARAKQLAELGPRVDAIAAELAALKATGDPRELERIRKELADVVDRMKAAERDITKLYRARPSRSPE
jgi:hypothetical protein